MNSEKSVIEWTLIAIALTTLTLLLAMWIDVYQQGSDGRCLAAHASNVSPGSSLALTDHLRVDGKAIIDDLCRNEHDSGLFKSYPVYLAVLAFAFITVILMLIYVLRFLPGRLARIYKAIVRN